MRYLILVLLLGISWITAGPNAAHAAGKKRPPTAPPPSETPISGDHGVRILRVLTYNVQGLPLPFGDHTRYADIGADLARRRAEGTAPDLVAIQEAFHSQTRDLLKYSGYPYTARGPKSAFLKFRSGLLVLSEHPIEGMDKLAFRECISWDCFSNKGVMHVRVNVPGVPQPVELYNTHLNSDPDQDRVTTVEQTREIRERQLVEAISFLERTNPTRRPVIFPGDFNFIGTDSQLDLLARGARLEEAGRTCASYRSCEGDGTAGPGFVNGLDHLFYGSGGSGAENGVRVEPVALRSVFTREVNGRMLSDHVGREVDFLLSW